MVTLLRRAKTGGKVDLSYVVGRSFGGLADQEIKRLASFHDLQPASVSEILQDGAREGRLNSITAKAPTEKLGVALAEDVPFDSQHFGFPICRLKICYASVALGRSAMANLVHETLARLLEMRYKCVYARVSLNDATTLGALEENNFRTMDILQTLKVDLKTATSFANKTRLSVHVRPFHRSDTPRIVQIARETYTPSRFFRDAQLEPDKVRGYYAKWAENCCGGLADSILVAELAGSILGFITVRRISDHNHVFYPNGGVIDLVRVHPDAQGRGIGMALAREAIEWFRSEGLRTAIIGTEANNVAALNCYIKSGFLAYSCKATLHCWL